MCLSRLALQQFQMFDKLFSGGKVNYSFQPAISRLSTSSQREKFLVEFQSFYLSCTHLTRHIDVDTPPFRVLGPLVLMTGGPRECSHLLCQIYLLSWETFQPSETGLLVP